MVWLLLLSTVRTVPAAGDASAAGTKPHLVMILQDDLGAYDNAFNGNDANLNISGNITRMAEDGIILTNHCTWRPSSAPCRFRGLHELAAAV